MRPAITMDAPWSSLVMLCQYRPTPDAMAKSFQFCPSVEVVMYPVVVSAKKPLGVPTSEL